MVHHLIFRLTAGLQGYLHLARGVSAVGRTGLPHTMASCYFGPLFQASSIYTKELETVFERALCKLYLGKVMHVILSEVFNPAGESSSNVRCCRR